MRTLKLIVAGVLIAIVLLFGCPKVQESPPPQQPPAPASVLTGLPKEMTVKQRTTTAVPGTDESLRVTVDDITRGQAMVSLAAKDGGVLLAPTSLEEGQSASFELSEKTYFIVLKEFHNELIGEDAATLVVTDVAPVSDRGETREQSIAASPEDQQDKIKQLIEHVRGLEGAVFIRNGQEHAAAAAADHLQRKWEYAQDDIETSRQFIDELASKSSTTGEIYQIRLKDGTEQPSGDYLHKQLAELEKGR